MASLLESVGQMLTPNTIGSIGEALGMDTSSVEQGMQIAGPTVLASLAQTSSTPDGAASLMNMLPKDTGGDMIGGLLNSLVGGQGGTGADMMNNVLGPGVNALSGTLSQKLGFDVKPLLMIAGPLVMSQLGKMVSQQKMDSAGVAQMLQVESRAYMNEPANKQVTNLVNSSLKAADEATVLRKTFSDSEWMNVRMAPIAAVYLVETVSPSGVTGQVKELMAAIGAVDEAVKSVSPTSLIGTAFGGGLTGDELDLLKRDAPPRDRILGVIRNGLATVRAKSPSDANAYRDMVIEMAQRTAEAAKEGGFLGIGGTQVSDKEQQALVDIRAALS